MARAPSSAARFEDLYRSCYQDLLGHALRRVDRPQDAADVVADTFLVAWRRLDEVPLDRSRPWLFGVARHVMANQHRADRRRADLAERLRQELSPATVVPPDVAWSIWVSADGTPPARQVNPNPGVSWSAGAGEGS